MFFFRLWLENTVFFDVLAFLVELRGWFAWCSWDPLLLLPFALGLSLVRLWPHFGLRVLSRQLYRQELMAELSALCWGSPLFTSYSSSWQFAAWIFLSFFFVCTSSVHLSLCTRCGSWGFLWVSAETIVYFTLYCRYLGRLWPYFGLSALSRQLHHQELMAELFVAVRTCSPMIRQHLMMMPSHFHALMRVFPWCVDYMVKFKLNFTISVLC